MTIRETSSRKPTHWLIIIGLFVLLIIFQCLATDIRSFWEDEAYTARMIEYDSKTIIDILAKDIHPPAYWLGVKAWANLFGFTKFGIKSFSVVWILFAFGLIYKFALDLFDKPVALVSTGLFTFSTLILTYGHTARYYSMGAALSLLAVLMAFSQIKKGKWLPLIIYVLAGALLLYTIYMGGTVLLALNIWWLLAWLRSERKILKLLEWSLAQLAILLLYAPWISFLISATRNNISVDITGINWITEIAVRIGYLGYAYSAGEFFSPLNPILWFGIILTIFIIIWAMIKWNWNLSLPLLILLVAGGISVVYTIISVYPISAWQSLPNRTLFIYPFFIIILAYGISQLKGKWFVITLTAILITYSVGAFNYFTNRQVIKPILIVPWETIIDDIQSQSAEDMVVICTNDDTACFYYQRRFGDQRIGPENVGNILEQHPSEIWWIQSNRIEFSNFKGRYAEQFTSLQEQYKLDQTYAYVPHDPSISMLKKRFLGDNVYEYRVIVYKFVAPEE